MTFDASHYVRGDIRRQGTDPTAGSLPEMASNLGKGRRTREALREAAIARFVAEGFDAVNVSDITADMGVTERTFYRHFASKEEVLFEDYERQLGWLRIALHKRAADEDLVDTVAAAVLSFPDDPRVLIEIARRRETLLGRERVAQYLRSVQGLVAKELMTFAADRFGEEQGGELRAAVWGEMLAGALFAAVTVWIERDGSWDLDELAVLTEEALDLIRPSLAADGSATSSFVPE